MQLSRLVPVTQEFPREPLDDVSAEVSRVLATRQIGSRLRPGARIAIAVGSRGITNLAAIVRATVAYFRDSGFEPFLIPAMGSHGGGTAEGQAKVLAHFGVTGQAMGCPVRSAMEVVTVGRTAEGMDLWMGREAYESDGVFLVNRVKWHTTFEAPVESGLLKMAAIGLGKREGAKDYHRHAVRLGFGPVIEAAGQAVVASGKILGGLAILEDAYHQTSKVVALDADEIPEEEPRLLELVKSRMPRLLFEEIDILLVDEIGKEISGVGMDSKVINRHPYGMPNPWTFAPRILRVYVRGLSAQTCGNANGFGMADMISERLYQEIDWEATKVNALTANNLACIRTPLRAASDTEALRILSGSVGRARPADVTCAWIRNSLELGRIVVTENLLAGQPHPDVRILGEPVAWEFDGNGDLTGGFDRFWRAEAAALPVA